jgi:hypothetical protein
MTLENFKISDDNIGIELENGYYIDLHNNYDLKNFEYNFENRSFRINFTKSKGDWVNENDPGFLLMKFKDVEILRMKEIDQSKESLYEYREDDKTLSSIGYTYKEDNEFLGYIVNPNNANELALVIQTQNDQGIIIYCKSIFLDVGDRRIE